MKSFFYRLTYLLILLLYSNYSYSQNIYGFGNSCLFSNSKTLGKSILSSLGERAVIRILEKKDRIICFIQIDSKGNPLSIDRVIYDSTDCYDIQRLKIYIYKCHYIYCNEESEKNNSKSVETEVNAIFKKRGSVLIGVVFPGILLYDYKEKEDDFLKKGISETEYLLSILKAP